MKRMVWIVSSVIFVVLVLGTFDSVSTISVPKLSTWPKIKLLIPSPAEKTITTVAMPITMPKTVKPVLTLLALMERHDIFMIDFISMIIVNFLFVP